MSRFTIILIIFSLITSFFCFGSEYNDILNNVTTTYAPAIQEAINMLVSKEDIENIHFKPLNGFSDARLFQFDVKDKKYVLRLLDENKPLERRNSELEAHRIGVELKMTPEIFYVDQKSLVMVMEFIEGRTLSRDDLNDNDIFQKVMQTLKKFHQYSGENHLFQQTRMKSMRNLYDRCLKKGVVFPSCFDNLHNQLQKDYDEISTVLLPSHGDFNPKNILLANDGSIYLIDWAGARIDNPFFDIGWLSYSSAATLDQTKNMLKAYLGREPYDYELNETLFFRKATTFFFAVIWIGRQKERDQEKLDYLLSCPIKKGSEYIKEGNNPEDLAKMEDSDFTIYALGWLKDFINNYTQN